MSQKFRPLAALRNTLDQIGFAVSASAEYTRAAAEDRRNGVLHTRLGQSGSFIPL
ncbi:hypothetical protein J5J10_11605 [Ciceribacter sp. L1K23]|uniref:hypothetical protein n=1 Tax=unclassified Ciceribacter TaxID=2628820 RepID=UPI001ABDD078|nr:MULTISPECIES: hypothetical protein [unclassified Ciceribacter]MBO3759521.1 hypothetical protein [Ciceribacter sp. L1K22]MBR0556323.1 hypothetical protein [Ciceribacter sp. L1K23]